MSREFTDEGDEQHVTLAKLTDAFLSVYYVDLSRDYIRTWKIDGEYAHKYGAVKSYSESMVEYMRNGIVEKDRARCSEMVSPRYVLNEFRTKDRFSIQTTDVMLGRERSIVFDFIKVSADGNTFVACCRDISEQIERERSQRQKLQEALEAVSVESAKNRILSDIALKLYSYNVTVDLDVGTYSVIIGTGSEDEVSLMKTAKDYRDLYERMHARLRPEFRNPIRELLSLDCLRMNADNPDRRGTGIYQVAGDPETAPWSEVTVTYGVNAAGRPVANVLGRDITGQHREAARVEREMKAAAAKDQLMAGIATALYGFNLTVDLAEDAFTMIKGTGMERFCELLESFSGRPYAEVSDCILNGVPESHRDEGYRVLSADFLLGYRGKKGHIGTGVLPWRDSDGSQLWIEVHSFMAENGLGHPVVNLLGRNITEQHEEQERKEREARAVAAKDQVLSGVTQSLYGYNIAINLETLQCSVLRGTGMDCIVAMVEECGNYQDVYEGFRRHLSAEDFERTTDLFSIEVMRRIAAEGANGFIGKVEYEYDCPVHGRHWHRGNLIITRNEDGEAVANVLVRDVTEEHRLQEAAAKLELTEAALKRTE